jgi:hypothetical protein
VNAGRRECVLTFTQLLWDPQHPVLGARWVEITELAVVHLEGFLACGDREATTRLFGSKIDVVKFSENMALVAEVAPDNNQQQLARRALDAAQMLAQLGMEGNWVEVVAGVRAVEETCRREVQAKGESSVVYVSCLRGRVCGEGPNPKP